MKNTGKHKLFTLSFGVLTALVVILFQVFLFQANQNKDQKDADRTEQGSEESPVLTVISQPSTVNSVVTFSLNQELSFIQDILFSETPADIHFPEIKTSASKLFIHLFRTLIAPNAP